MSTYTDASLILYPSGYKEDKLYSLKPTDGSGDLTFTRASSATRVNADGLIETATIFGSEEITNGDFATNLNSWSTSSWWVWNASGAYHPSTNDHKPLYQQCCVIGKTYKITFDLNCVGSSQAKFSLGSSIGSTTQVIGTSLTTGSYSYFVTAAAEYIIFNRQNTAEFYVDNVSVKEVITLNVPRIDYTGGGCGKLLLEKQSTNLITYSSEFDNASWTKSNSTITANATTSPDGTTNADFIIPTVTSGIHTVSSNVTVSSGTHTLSVFAKKGIYKNLLVWFNGHSGGIGVNLDTLAVFRNENNIGFKIENYGDGWIRISVTCAILTSSVPNFYTYDNSATPQITWAGNGTDGLFIYGAQLESNALYVSSYIPTTSTSVTRVADSASKTGISSLIGQTEGTIFLDFESGTFSAASAWAISVNDGSTSNYIGIRKSGTAEYFTQINTSGVNQSLFSLGFNGGRHKVAIGYANNEIVAYVDGVLAGSDNLATIPATSVLDVGNLVSGRVMEGSAYQALLFKTRLTNDQLADLTGGNKTTFNALATFYGYTIL